MSITQRLWRHIQFIGRPPDSPVPAGVERKREAVTIQEGQIDVRDLIARYDAGKHAELADAYFEPLLNNPIIRRKPFAQTHEAIQIMGEFAHVLDGLRLFQQAKVLDFGAGTCWSSRILASLAAQVTAVDISRNALNIGKSIQEQDPLTRDLPIDYRVFNGLALPAEDATFDRILSFDAFHHVADQAAVLREFARVLTDDGIAGFAEPGPHHSLTPSSQMEMKAFNVIENDIRVEEIWAIARECGFADIKLSFVMPRQELVSLQDFNRIIAAQSAPDDVVFSRLNANIHGNRRVFFLHKSASVVLDSRSAEGLHYVLRLVEVSPPMGPTGGQAARLVLELKNTGISVWRPSGGHPGSVNIGVHLRTQDGQLINNDYARLPVSSSRVVPGQDLRLTVDLPLPDIASFEVELDLVSENVTWFEMFSNAPLKLSFSNGQYRAR